MPQLLPPRGLIAFCVLLLGLTAHGAAWAQDKAAQEAELKKLKATIEQLRKELESTKSDRDGIHQSLEKTEKNIGELSKKAEQLRRELQGRQQKLQELRDERGELQEQKSTQQRHVGDYVNAAYRLGNQGQLRLMLNQEDPARVTRNLKYYQYLMAARAEKIEAFVGTIERLNQIEPEIVQQTSAIEDNYQQLQRRQQEMKQAQAERKQTLASLNSRIASQDQKLRRSQEDRRQLERLLARVIENFDSLNVADNGKPFPALKGQLPWPAKGRVVQRYGSNRVAQRVQWEGILIASPAGEPVTAVHHGRVVFSDYLRGHGLLIILDHGSGYMTLYAHNQALYKELGEWVNRGDAIAAVGNSGGQQDSALYFELRYRGKPTNPQGWLRRA